MQCERHEEVIEMLEVHDDRIRTLELSEVKLKSNIENLILQMDKLMTTLEKFMEKVGVYTIRFLAFVGITGLGFLLWYIQTH